MSQNDPQNDAEPAGSTLADAATPYMALLFAAIGGIVWWDTTTYTDADSYVFPRAIAAALVALSGLSALQWLLGLKDEPQQPNSPMTQGAVRRVALVAAMLAAGLAMPVLGFFLTGVLTFLAILTAAMHDPWTPGRLIAYPLAGIAIVAGFYLLFARALLVPLPEGVLGISL